MIVRQPSNQDLLLYLIGKVDKIIGSTRLQKYVFLIEWFAKEQKQLDKVFQYKFVRYNYGPYSFELTDEISNLVHAGLVKRTTSSYMGNERSDFALTENGENVYREIEDKVPKEFDVYLKKMLSFENNFKDLQSFVSGVYDLINLREKYEMNGVIIQGTNIDKNEVKNDTFDIHFF